MLNFNHFSMKGGTTVTYYTYPVSIYVVEVMSRFNNMIYKSYVKLQPFYEEEMDCQTYLPSINFCS
jgi:hypothetical protein